MDDVFNHVMVEDYQNGDLRIRRLVDGVYNYRIGALVATCVVL